VYWKGAPPVGNVEIMKELTDAYNVLYGLVGKDVRTYMKKQSDIAQAKSDLKYYNKKSYMTDYRVRRLREEADKLQKKLDDFNKKIEECKKVINS
jgi:peptidoglycan hydrolase CwlO-like protein